MRDLSWVATVLLATVSAVAIPVRAEAQEMTESEAIARALADNARLRAMRLRPTQVAADQAIRRLAPNPVVTFLQEDSAGTRDSFLAVQQELPTNGRLGLLSQAGTAAVQVADFRVKQAEYEVRQETRVAFTRLASAQRRVQGLTATLSTLDALTKRLAERERAGDSSTFDRLRAEREQADVRAMHRAAEGDLAAARASLAGLLGISGEAPLIARDAAPAATAVPGLNIVLQTARSRRLDLLAADAQIGRLGLEAQAASRLGVPQPIVSGGWKNTDARGLSDTGYTFSVGLAIPLFNRGQADVASANAALAATRAERDALTVEIEQEVRGAHARASTLGAVAAEYQRDALDRSRELVRIATLAYDDGELGILELLDAHRSLLNAELRAIELAGEARLATISLERAIGEEVK